MALKTVEGLDLRAAEDSVLPLDHDYWNYSLTITFKSELNKYKPWQQFRDTIGVVSRHIASCSDDFEIYPELTLKGRIHYHIRLLLKDKIAFYKKLIPFLNKCGHFDLGKTLSLNDWLEYCKKDHVCMKEVLEFPFIPITKNVYKNKIKNNKIFMYYKFLFEDKISRKNTLDKLFKQRIKYNFDKDEDEFDDDECRYDRAITDDD